MYISLKLKIWILVNLAILSFAAFSFIYLPSWQYNYLCQSQEKEVQYIANSIATGVGIALAEENFQGINAAMEYARSDSRFCFAAMLQTDSSETSPVIFRIFPEDAKIEYGVASNEHKTVKRASFSSEIMNGEIILGFNTNEISANVSHLRRSILIASVIALLLYSVIAYFISGSIIRPLRSLRKASMAIGAGNLEPTVNVTTNDEVADLGKAFVNMTAEIRKSREKIGQKNRELIQANQELVELNKEKNNLITVVSHDLKSPLYQIQGLLSLIREECKTINQNNLELLNKADDSLSRLSGMISKILDVEAIESHQHNLNIRPVNLITLLRQTIRNYYLIAEDKKLEIRCDHDIRYLVEVDPDYAVQVFDNLLSNAIKFSPANSVISINIVDKGSYIATEFADAGPGVSKEDRPKLFQKYQKLSARPTSNETSTGLGLSIVKKYVELLNGRVYYRQSDEAGSIFVVEFMKAAIGEKAKKV